MKEVVYEYVNGIMKWGFVLLYGKVLLNLSLEITVSLVYVARFIMGFRRCIKFDNC